MVPDSRLELAAGRVRRTEDYSVLRGPDPLAVQILAEVRLLLPTAFAVRTLGVEPDRPKVVHLPHLDISRRRRVVVGAIVVTVPAGGHDVSGKLATTMARDQMLGGDSTFRHRHVTPVAEAALAIRGLAAVPSVSISPGHSPGCP